jgi:hypothetical protein
LKRTRYEHKRVHGKRQQYNDYCSSKDDKAYLLDKYGQPLELPKSNTTNNHEQQIYRLRSRVVGNRQANEKMLGFVRTAGHQKRTSSKSKLKQSKPATNANYKSTKPMKSKSTSQFRNKSNI